ncbi:uncharacterized protein DUF4307 [Motilibacter rhizosphaerae]|uniref:Uncharacterized protein DUF4307 n=1 Tax=Motilibacter rhizosphaerae TaxID=598652 RepID=A0A4Q7NPS0_9ACTN|nr:DUF4307 domain-containing protein [Motilibacter rhizosphaerae]RZS87315.1 uncharacterized protein DUF4307 [Motilibacter rhizosphaerae]
MSGSAAGGPAAPAPARARPAERYGDPRPGARRALVVGGAAVAALLVAFLAWVALRGTGSGPTGSVARFMRLGPTSLSADLTATGPAGEALACAVRATDGSGGTVGRLRVVLPAGSRTRTARVVVPTVSPASGVDVVSCSVARPAAP